MFNFFKKKHVYDLKFLKLDMHSHLLPGVDDGCPNVEVSLQCIDALQELGIEKFYTTPHVFAEMYPNNPGILKRAEGEWKAELEFLRPGLSSKINLAAEYMIDDDFKRHVKEEGVMELPNRHILIEMSYQFERKDILEQIFNLQISNYTPILAHPERYLFYHASPKTYKEIKNKGCLFQLNLLSLTGYYGSGIKKVALNLLKEGMIDFVGTDVHHMKHIHAIQSFARENNVEKMLGGNPIKNRNWL